MKNEISFEVIIDTREKKPWELASSRIIGREVRKLETGDYTVKGLEDKLCIDRKASVNELALNITQPRFKRELERVREFPHAFFVLEASVDDIFNYPNAEKMPYAIKKKIKLSGNYLMRCLCKMQIKYNFNIIFAGNRTNAQRIAVNLMEDVLARYHG